jgi:hypothetical protein
MDKRTFLKSVAAFAAAPSIGAGPRTALAGAPEIADWSLNLDVLESCSCPVFCQCFFTGKPPAAEGTGHHHAAGEKHYCRFNQAYRVNSGHSGSVRLDGVRFWFLGDAGDDFGKAKLEWSILSFDPGVSREQRDALLGGLRHLRWYRPERWRAYRIGEDAPIEWAADERGAHATLGGAVAELTLSTMLGLHDEPVKISNMEYFGYPRNTGFILMPSTVLAYRGVDHPFEFKDKGTNGFLTTLEISALDFPS